MALRGAILLAAIASAAAVINVHVSPHTHGEPGEYEGRTGVLLGVRRGASGAAHVQQ